MDSEKSLQFDEELVTVISRRIAALTRQNNVDGAMLEFEYLRRLADRVPSALVPPDVLRPLLELVPQDDKRRESLADFIDANQHKLEKQRQAHERATSLGPPELRAYRTDLPPLDDKARAQLTHDLQPNAEWLLEPLYETNWEIVDADAAAQILYRGFTALKDDPTFAMVRDRGVRAIRRDKPVFYDDVEIVELLLVPDQAYSDVPESIVLLMAPFGVTYINGRADRVYLLNSEYGVRLDSAENAMHYLRFFCGVVHGEDGGFAIIDSAEQLRNRVSGGDEAHIQHIWDSCQKLVVADPGQSTDALPNWRLRATVHYSDTLYNALFEMEKSSGMVQMVEDNPMFGDLHARISTFADGGVRRLKQQ